MKPSADLEEERDGFRFRGGHHAIDLPATLQARLRPSPRELLRTPRDLDRWLVSAGLASAPPEASAEDLATAHQLREAIYALAHTLLPAGGDGADARETLNRIATGHAAVPQLTPSNDMRLEGTAAALLVTVARDAICLFGGEAGRIRQCQSDTCTLFFVDTSRAGDRRWCSMSGCGNRAKVAEFRQRKRKREHPSIEPNQGSKT